MVLIFSTSYSHNLVKLNRRENGSLALAKSYIAPLLTCHTAEDNRVAVLEEHSLRAVGKLDRVLPTRLLENAALALGIRAGDGTAAE